MQLARTPNSEDMPITPAISMQDVRFAYKPARPILHVDKLEILPGRRIFLHGPSGSGKTTLLSLISGVLVPQTGSISVLGQDLTLLSALQIDLIFLPNSMRPLLIYPRESSSEWPSPAP